MSKKVEDQVRNFYDEHGWKQFGEYQTAEDYYFRNYKKCSAAYRGKYNSKVRDCFRDADTDTLLIAGCGDMPDSHLELAKEFAHVVCVDISQRALDISREKLGGRGDFYLTSILDMPLPDNSVSAILCSHVLYHIDRQQQPQAVENMIRALKPGGVLAVLYTNSRAPLMIVQRVMKFLGVNRLLKRNLLYFYSYSLNWWRRFEAECHLRIEPLEIMSNDQENALVPDSSPGRKFFAWAARFEDKAPAKAKRLWTYVAVVLTKK